MTGQLPTDPPPRDLRTQELIMLGEIRGIAQGLRDGQATLAARFDQFEERIDKRFDGIDDRFDGMDDRLRVVEQRSAVAGAISGGAVSVGLALLVEGVKAWLTRPGGP